MSTETQNPAPNDDSNAELDGVVIEAPSPDDSSLVEPNLDDGTPSEDTPSKESEEGINQEKVDKKINKLTFEKHEERRKREKVEADRKELQDKFDALTARNDQIQVPPIPDTFDVNYEAKVKARDEALIARAKQDAEQNFAAQQQQSAIEATRKAESTAIQKHIDTMLDSCKKLGIEKETLKAADDKVAMFVKDPSLAKFIISQENAALVITYLAASAQELEKISSMDPVSASAYIATAIVPKANALKPGVTQTPEPLDIPRGTGGNPNDSQYLKGVQME